MGTAGPSSPRGRTELVADDVVSARASGGGVVLDAPPSLRGLVEVRGTGLAVIAAAGPTTLRAILVLADRGRLPDPMEVRPLGEDGPAVPTYAWQGGPAGLLTFLRSVASGHSATAGHDAAFPT